mmetsp:Transcript_4354/g.5055  ORF Transcript_4354/g.5055 Transcript_4354/m.5055 type:complete len:248 (+) Transcript_4354:147-890(+)
MELETLLSNKEAVFQVLGTIVVGACVLYGLTVLISSSKKVAKPNLASQRALKRGSVNIDLNENEEADIAEAQRDFLRSLDAVRVVTKVTSISFEKLENLKKRSAFDLLLSVVQDEYSGNTDLKLLLNRILKHIRVAPGISVLLDAEISPPALFQPRYTLVLSENSAFVITDGFAGQPCFGPPDPNKKYTEKRIRYMTENLANLKSETAVLVNYYLCSTAKKKIEDEIDIEQLQHCLKSDNMGKFLEL